MESYCPGTSSDSVIQLTHFSVCSTKLWKPNPNTTRTRGSTEAEWMTSSAQLRMSSEWSTSSYIHSDNTAEVKALSIPSSTCRPVWRVAMEAGIPSESFMRSRE